MRSVDRAAGGVLVRYGYPFRSIGLLLRGAEHHAVALEAGEIPRLEITEHHDVPVEKRLQRVVLPQARGDQPRCLRRSRARSVRLRRNGTAHVSGRMAHEVRKVNQRPAQGTAHSLARDERPSGSAFNPLSTSAQEEDCAVQSAARTASPTSISSQKSLSDSGWCHTCAKTLNRPSLPRRPSASLCGHSQYSERDQQLPC